MSQIPQSLTPMESALLNSLQKSSDVHEQRLTDLEKLLREFAEHSETNSSSDRQNVQDLLKRLEELGSAVSSLSERIGTWQREAVLMKTNYDRATDAFNLMADKYQTLSLELQNLKSSLE